MSFKKSIKRLVLILVSIWLVLVIIGLIFSRSVQDKIIEALTSQADKHLLAEVQVRKNDIHFSVIKKFPLASIELRNIVVKVPADFDLKSVKAHRHDTLLFAEKVYLQLDLMSVFKKDYQLKKISISRGFLQIMTDKNQNSSLKIFRSSSSDKDFKANIESFLADEVLLYYSSYGTTNKMVLQLTKGETSGVFVDENFFARIKADGYLQKVHLQGDKLKPMQKFRLSTSIEKRNDSYLIEGGDFSISNIPMQLAGSIKKGKNTFIDLVFSAQGASVKQIDSDLLSGLIGKTGIEPKSGRLDLHATIKGYIQKSAPSINANFTVREGRILDKKYNRSYNNIYLKGTFGNFSQVRGKSDVKVTVDTFNVRLGKSNQHGTLTINGMKNPMLFIQSKGQVDVKDFVAFLPEQKFDLKSGSLSNDLKIEFRLPKEGTSKVKDLTVSGHLNLTNVRMEMPSATFPPLNLNGNCYINSLNNINLDTLKCKAAQSDLSIKGRLLIKQSGRIPYSFSGTLVSNKFYVDDFLSEGKKEGEETKPIIFPDSLQFSGSLDIDQLFFGKFHPQQIKANANYYPKSLKINNIVLNAFSGAANGNLELQQLMSNSDIRLEADAVVQSVNVEAMFDGFNSFGQDVIGKENLKGILSGKINFISEWSSTLKLDPASIVTEGNIILKNGELNNYEPLMGLSKFINVEELKQVRFDNLNTKISIHSRKVLLDQTEINSSAISFSGSGIHDFDNKYEYRLQVGLSDLLWNKAHKRRKDISEFGYVSESDNNKTMIPLMISGKGTTFDVKYDRKTSRTNFKERVEREKIELKKLFNDSENDVDKEEFLIIDTAVKKAPKLQKTDSGKYRHKTDEFILEWDDSEDDDNDN